MTTISLVLVTALAFAGCKKTGADCATALDRSMELSKADMQKAPGMDDTLLQKLKDLGVQHCKDDNWPAEALACMANAKTEADSRGCYAKLSSEQQAKMNKAAMATMMPPSGAAGSTAGAGSAMGSDTGSASGSAGSAG